MTTHSIATINHLIKNKDTQTLIRVLGPLSGYEIAHIIVKRKVVDQVLVLSLLSTEQASETFEYLPFKVQKNLLKAIPTTQAANILVEMAPDDLTAFFEELPQALKNEYLNLLPKEERDTATHLLGYPENTVGRMMTPDYLAIKMDWTIEKVLDYIRTYGHDSETINVIYVVDDHNILLDDIKLKEFLFAPKDYQVHQIADNKFVALTDLDDSQKAINIFKEYSRVALPVINAQGVLVGIVTIDDILRLASQNSTEEFQKIAAVEVLDESYMDIPFFSLIKKRARWLVLLFIGEMFTATAMGFFEDEISKAVVLALFLPLIISSGGNAGSQSSTLIIRAMALGEVKLKDWWLIMRREILAGALLGCFLGVVGFSRVTLWSAFSDVYGIHWLLIAFTIFFSLIGVVLWGSLSGSMLPFILRRCGVDPATSSAPLVATLVDVTGIIIYFVIAMGILKGTLL